LRPDPFGECRHVHRREQIVDASFDPLIRILVDVFFSVLVEVDPSRGLAGGEYGRCDDDPSEAGKAGGTFI